MGKHKSSHPFSAHDMITDSSAAAHSSLTLIPLPKPTIRQHSPNILTTPPQGRAAKAAELGTSIRRTVESLVPSSADEGVRAPVEWRRLVAHPPSKPTTRRRSIGLRVTRSPSQNLSVSAFEGMLFSLYRLMSLWFVVRALARSSFVAWRSLRGFVAKAELTDPSPPPGTRLWKGRLQGSSSSSSSPSCSS